MSKKKRNFIISFILILSSVIFTILVKIVDVKPSGVNGTSIGFSSINQFIFNLFGVNMIWYYITDWIAIVPLVMAIIYAFIGFRELIKKKSIFKVDKEIILLGIFYIIVISLYIFFEIFIINYRPILINNYLEASYPSSHTLMTICLCGSSIMINKKLFSKNTKLLNILLFLIIIITVIGRLISGVHWFTDIIGGILISISLLMTLYSVISVTNKND